MVAMMTVHQGLPLRWFVAVMLTIWCASATGAQERPLQPVVHGDIAPGVPQTYTFRAEAGDVIFGTFEVQGAGVTGTIALYDENGAKVREFLTTRPRQLPIGFIAPKKGAYWIRIAATTAGSYTLQTKRQTPGERVAGVIASPVVRFESPRVTQLAKDVSTGTGRAVERFWSEAETRAGPIVEQIEGNATDVLVTFLWKEIYETHSVLVVWYGANLRDYAMSRLPRTNVWYKTVRVRRGSRFMYRLSPNARGDATDLYFAQIDPLNPRNESGESIVETPGAPDESVVSRTSPVRGLITQHSLDSVLLKRRRDVSIYTPPGYSPANGPYALLVLLDGRIYLGFAPNLLDNLIADHRIRPTVVCFVSDNREMYPEQGQTYAAAMGTEFVRWIRSSYAISANPQDVVIGGYSAGAEAAGYVAFNNPSVFGNVLLQSGGSGGLGLLIDAPKMPVRYYIDTGLYEDGNWASLTPEERVNDDGWSDVSSQSRNWLLRMRLLHAVLRAKGYDVTYRETGAAHEGVHWRATLAEGLIGLLGQPVK